MRQPARRAAVALALLAALVHLAPAAAAADVALLSVEHPDRVVYDKRWPVEATVENLGREAVTVRLFSAIYTPDAQECGSSAGSDYHGEASTRNVPVHLAPGERATYPGPQEKRAGYLWWHHVNASNDVPGGGEYEVCVFVVHPDAATPDQYWQDHRAFRVQLRMTNAPPGGDFTVEPGSGTTDTTFTFTATSGDDDGDAVQHHWDFNDWTAKGPATAQGERVTHRFYPPGVYTVNLTLSDGWDERVISKQVVVRAPGAAGPAGGFGVLAPGAAWVAAAVTLAALLLAPPRGSRR